MEELETVVKLYRDKLRDIEESKDSEELLNAVANVYNENAKLIERNGPASEVANKNSSFVWEIGQYSEGKVIQRQASEPLHS